MQHLCVYTSAENHAIGAEAVAEADARALASARSAMEAMAELG